MSEIIKINDNVFRTVVPYKTIFTTLYLIKTDEGALLFDSASYDNDARDYIIPFLTELGVGRTELKYVFISHNHKDHSGGLASLLIEFPDVCVLSRSPALKEKFNGYKVYSPEHGEIFLGCLKAIPIPGHTHDSCALLDIRNNALYTGDCLQFYGICGNEDWASNVGILEEHFSSLRMLEKLDVDFIYSAHDYYPYGYKYIGKDAVKRGIEACREPLLRLKTMIENNSELSDLEIRALYNNDPSKPTISAGVVGAMRAVVEKGISLE